MNHLHKIQLQRLEGITMTNNDNDDNDDNENDANDKASKVSGSSRNRTA